MTSRVSDTNPRGPVPELAVFWAKRGGRAPVTPIDADIATITGATDKILRAAGPPDMASQGNGKLRFGRSIHQAFVESFHVAASLLQCVVRGGITAD